jgi:predicted transcriptional regulator
MHMTRTSLTNKQREALALQPEGIEVEDPKTQRVYVLVDAELHRRAIEALARRDDCEAIRSGIADMEMGRVVSLEEVDCRIRERLQRLQ